MKKLLIISLCLFILGCSNSNKTYHIKHKDGRKWHLDGPPLGYGCNGIFYGMGKWGQPAKYAWRDNNGFVTEVDQKDVTVEEINHR